VKDFRFKDDGIIDFNSGYVKLKFCFRKNNWIYREK
jgi:hypothetical protein